MVLTGGLTDGSAPAEAAYHRPHGTNDDWVDWFNNRRLLEPIGNVPPVEYEQQYYQAQDAPAMRAGVN